MTRLKTSVELWLLRVRLLERPFHWTACFLDQQGNTERHRSSSMGWVGFGQQLGLGIPCWQRLLTIPLQWPSRHQGLVSCNSTFLNFRYPGAGTDRWVSSLLCRTQCKSTILRFVSEVPDDSLRQTLRVSAIETLALSPATIHNGFASTPQGCLN